MRRAIVQPFSPSFRRSSFLAVVLAGAAGVLALAAGEPPPAGPVVELPKFVVTDTRDLPPPEAWRYGEIPGFEILSNASDKATTRLIDDFSMFKQALGYVWPVPNRASVPTALIVCGRGGKFDAFVPAGKTSAEGVLASIFLKDRDQTAIVIDLEASTLNISGGDTTDDAATGTDSTQIAVDHNKQLYREYVHYLLSKSEPRTPAWFEEGMAQIIMAMKFDSTSIVFGKLEDPNTISAAAGMIQQLNAAATADDPDADLLPGAPVEDRDFNAALQHKALVPLDKFFAVQHDSPEALNPLGNNRWAKQAYAFVHLCLYGEGGRFQKGFAQFLVRSAKEPVTEAMFKECFGMTYKSMLLQLRGYIDVSSYKSIEFSVKKGQKIPQPPGLVLREATPAEVGRIKGGALELAGHKEQAHTELIAPYVRGERDPRLLAALGLDEHAAGHDDRARKFLEAAVAAKVGWPRAYLELARFRYADALAQPAAPDQRFSPAQSDAVVDLLMAARSQPPSLPEVYELIADTWVRSATPPGRDRVGLVVEGARLFPGHLKLVYQAAALCAQAGVVDVAHRLADYGLEVAPDATSKAHFQELKAGLPPLPPSEKSPAGSAAPKS